MQTDMIQALFIDAAGTLIHPAEPVAHVYARLFRSLKKPPASETIASRFASAFGNLGDPDYDAHPNGDLAERSWWRDVVSACADEPVDDSVFLPLFDHYAEASSWTIFPEVSAALESFRKQGLRLAVVSNFDLRLHGILRGLDLARHFELILTSAEARARKPSPRIFEEALRRIGLGHNEVIHIGDSRKADLEGAASAGIRALLVKRPETDLTTLNFDSLQD